MTLWCNALRKRAIYYMPAVAQIDFIKATKRAGGDYDTVNFVTKPFGSEKGFLTANDTTAYAWGSISTRHGAMVVEVPPMTDKIDYFGSFISSLAPAHDRCWFQRC